MLLETTIMRKRLNHLALLLLLTACTRMEPETTPDKLPISETATHDSIHGSVPTVEDQEADNQAAFDAAGLLAGPGAGFIVLDNPVVVPAGNASWLSGDELVLGVAWNGEARAYPISQMAYHHIANDEIGGKPFLVTY